MTIIDEAKSSLTLAREHATRARSFTNQPMPPRDKAMADAVASLAFTATAVLEQVLASAREVSRLAARVAVLEHRAGLAATTYDPYAGEPDFPDPFVAGEDDLVPEREVDE